MSDGEPRSEILRLEVEIEELAEVIERWRKIILFSKIAVAAGGIWLLALTIGIGGIWLMALAIGIMMIRWL